MKRYVRLPRLCLMTLNLIFARLATALSKIVNPFGTFMFPKKRIY